MDRLDEMRKPVHLAKAASLAGLLVLMWLLSPGVAQACCSCNGALCSGGHNPPLGYCCGPYCIDSSNDCVCGAQKPVCNVFGCNCNSQCGQWPCTLASKPSCSWIPTCNNSAEVQERFDSIDGNHDRKISFDEAAAWMQSQDESWVKSIHKLPENLSAPNTSRTEILRYLIDRIDTDKDGFIQPAEFDKDLVPSAKTGS